MKFSILNTARIGMAVFCLNLCPSLQASQQDINVAIKNLNSTGFDCKACEKVLPSCLVKEKIVPHSVVESEELWRFNAIYLKDAIEIIAFGSTGNEVVVISDRIIDNAQLIAGFLQQHSELTDEISKVKFLLIEQAFTLYDYTIASKSDPSRILAIESVLETQNEELLGSLSLILKAKSKKRGLLAVALNNRLETLKNEALGFVHAFESGYFLNAYKAFNNSLLVGQEVGALIGWAFFFNK